MFEIKLGTEIRNEILLNQKEIGEGFTELNIKEDYLYQVNRIYNDSENLIVKIKLTEIIRRNEDNEDDLIERRFDLTIADKGEFVFQEDKWCKYEEADWDEENPIETKAATEFEKQAYKMLVENKERLYIKVNEQEEKQQLTSLERQIKAMYRLKSKILK